MTNEEKINLIGKKILLLSNNLDNYKIELVQLQEQLHFLQGQVNFSKNNPTPPVFQNLEEAVSNIIPPIPIPVSKQETPEIKKEIPEVQIPGIFQTVSPQSQISSSAQQSKITNDFNFEEFIASKLITIIGIVILVIGIGIGVKYAIDQDLLGPLARIVLAYIAGGIILLIALKLKINYKTFSAVLLSGGMASLYFTTFAGYSMYQLFPQMAAFSIMVVFTAFTVFAATVYALEIIGIIGLVGAYAVPMLLSDGSGKIEIMFSYMAIINAGILILSFKKLWRILNHFAFGFTWLIVLTWFFSKYNYEEHTALLLVFSFLFFVIFYISNIAYKVVKKESFGVLDVIRIITNSFIFFGIGYASLNHEIYRDYLGLFSLSNSIVHLVFSYVVFKNKLIDRKLFFLLIALVLSFLTIAVPIQLEGNWVTLFWSAEAVLLFIIGRYKNIRFYEWLSYALVIFATFSLLQDWGKTYYYYYFYETGAWLPFLNIHLFSSLFFITTLGIIIYVHHHKNITVEERARFSIYIIAEYILPTLLFLIIYLAINNEISAYFKFKYNLSVLKIPSKVEWAEPGAVDEIYNYSLLKLRDVVQHIYNLAFFSITSILVIRNWKNNIIRWSSLGLNLFATLIFILSGLNQLGELRDQYLNAEQAKYFLPDNRFIYIRYICFVLLLVLLYLTHLLLKKKTFKNILAKIYSGSIIHFFLVIVLSNELIHLTVLYNYGTDESYYISTKIAYKLGLTSLWGIYSFILIAYGIFRKNQVMRISAISLFGITLFKLVTYDTWDLSTGYKVVAYMLLGVILLVVAFLYQKFKQLIFGEDERNLS